jgi:hypothetical protein
MKKKYLFKSVLTLLFTAFIFVQTKAQIRILRVDPATEVVTIHNYGSTTVDISGYYFCQFPIYFQVSSMTVNSGSTMLAAGADVTITSLVNFGNTDGEFGLYTAAGSPLFTSNMVDYLQWGSSGHVREPVAVSAGIWTAGTFIGAAPPFEYVGDGSQNGVGFWDTVLGIEDFKNVISFSIFPNPVTSILNIQFSKSLTVGNIKVFDILGKQLLNEEINSNNLTQLNVSNLSKGMYLIKVTSGENTQTKRFIKQ